MTCVRKTPSDISTRYPQSRDLESFNFVLDWRVTLHYEHVLVHRRSSWSVYISSSFPITEHITLATSRCTVSKSVLIFFVTWPCSACRGSPTQAYSYRFVLSCLDARHAVRIIDEMYGVRYRVCTVYLQYRRATENGEENQLSHLHLLYTLFKSL